MKYDIYDGDEKSRFVLGKAGQNPLFVVGVNPSTADRCKSDRTIEKVEKLVRAWHFDGFIMLNLYPARTAKPGELPSLLDPRMMRRNAEVIREQIKNSHSRVVWAAWGDAFDSKDYFLDCLEKILRAIKGMDVKWSKCDSVTDAKNPRHPLPRRPPLITENSKLTEFDVEKYLDKKKSKKLR